MRTILILLTLSFSLRVQAELHHDCMSEAVEVNLAYKMSKISNGNCSSIKRDGFMDFGEERNNKKRFLVNALKSLDSGGKIPSRLFSSFDHSGVDTELGKNDICEVVNKRSQFAVKEMMEDCPEGAEMFQYMLGKRKEMEKVSDVILSEACHTVENLKKQACDESKKKSTYFADKEPSGNLTIKKLPGVEGTGGSMSASAVAQ